MNGNEIARLNADMKLRPTPHSTLITTRVDPWTWGTVAVNVDDGELFVKIRRVAIRSPGIVLESREALRKDLHARAADGLRPAQKSPLKRKRFGRWGPGWNLR